MTEYLLAPVVKDAPTDDLQERGSRVLWPWSYRFTRGETDMDIPELQSGGRHASGHSPEAERWPDLKARATALRLAPGAKAPAGSEDASPNPNADGLGSSAGDADPAGQK
jgi:hypothetical protein